MKRNFIHRRAVILALVLQAVSFDANAGQIFPPQNIASCQDGQNLVFRTNGTDQWVECAASTIPSGLVGYFQVTTCPVGWLPANGTNGNVDLRGEFVRGVDSGRGVDPGRVLNSWQQATGLGFWSHQSAYNEVQNPDSTYAAGYNTQYDGFNPYNSGQFFYTFRPRNVALLACVKS